MSERGLHADLRALIDAGDEPAAGDQLDLGIFDDFESPVQAQMAARDVAIRRPGRPQGSKTRTNVNIVRLIRATKRPTLLALKELADLSLDDFARATGITKPAEVFDRWMKVAELVTAYEEGRPTARVEIDAKGGPVMPVVVFGDVPVRPDLVDGNPPDDGAMIDVTDWREISENDAEQSESSPPKAHDDGEGLSWSDEDA